MIIDLFHGSENIIESPMYGKGNPRNDYGLAFYTTQDESLAKEWAVDKNRSGYANHYQLDMELLSVLDFSDGDYTILHWLAVLLCNRSFEITTDFGPEAKAFLLEHYLPEYERFDVIKGYRADNSYFSFAQDFLNNEISLSMLSNAMRLGLLGEQIAIKSPKAFDRLQYISSGDALSDEWYPKKEYRDSRARRKYAELRKEPWKRGEIYMMSIIDGEIMPDDERLRQYVIK